jgi:hypothetical protein
MPARTVEEYTEHARRVELALRRAGIVAVPKPYRYDESGNIIIHLPPDIRMDEQGRLVRLPETKQFVHQRR